MQVSYLHYLTTILWYPGWCSLIHFCFGLFSLRWLQKIQELWCCSVHKNVSLSREHKFCASLNRLLQTFLFYYMFVLDWIGKAHLFPWLAEGKKHWHNCKDHLIGNRAVLLPIYGFIYLSYSFDEVYLVYLIVSRPILLKLAIQSGGVDLESKPKHVALFFLCPCNSYGGRGVHVHVNVAHISLTLALW